MTMNVRPLHDHLIVKPVSDQEVTKSGIVLPDTVDKEKPEKGEVLAVGPGKRLESGARAEMAVAVGDVVLFKKYAPDEIKIDGQELLVIAESDVMAIIEK